MKNTIKSGLCASLFVGLAIGTAGCQRLTLAEAREAVEESQIAAQASALTADVVTITTDFTIADAVEQSAMNLADFVRSQVPCSTVSVSQGRVEIDFGDLSDNCVHRGRTFAGQVAVEVMRVAAGEIEVTHTWTGLTDGKITVDGTATVTWSRSAMSRRVVHESTWTHAGGEIKAEGDRTQTLVDASMGIRGGIRIDGSRNWTSSRGRWDLQIQGVEVRGLDPVPQAGAYVLTTPANKQATLRFTRQNETTIRVTFEGPRRTRTFDVVRGGGINNVEE